MLPGCFITNHILNERECLPQAMHRARRPEPGMGRQWLAGEGRDRLAGPEQANRANF